jgi:hypothetical protein
VLELLAGVLLELDDAADDGVLADVLELLPLEEPHPPITSASVAAPANAPARNLLSFISFTPSDLTGIRSAPLRRSIGTWWVGQN